MVSLRLSPSQWTLLSSSILYQVAFYFSTPPKATPARFAQTREAISVFHCSLMTALSLVCLRLNSESLFPSVPSVSAARSPSRRPLAESDSDLPIIAARSEFASSITALETGYLLQDSLVLFWADRVHRHAHSQGFKSLKGLNVKHLAYHHAGLVCALGTLQWYIAQGRDKGVLIITMMMLMNASSPIGAYRWFLVNFRPSYRRAIATATFMYLAMYGVCRVYLIYYILRVFGAQRGGSAIDAFSTLRIPCKLGTGTMALVNSAWLVMGISKLLTRELGTVNQARKRK